MKRWLTVFSAVVAAGGLLLAVQWTLTRRAQEETRRRESLVRHAGVFLGEARKAATAEPSRALVDDLTAMEREGAQLVIGLKSGAENDAVGEMLETIRGRRAELRGVDWGAVEQWTEQVRVVGNTLRLAIDDEKLGDDGRLAAVQAAHKRIGDLRESAPRGARLGELEAVLDELKSALQRVIRR